MIDFASEFAGVWGAGLWRASWQGAIVLAAAWAIPRWCTFLSPRVVCWVWRLACLKLLVALVWTSPIAIAVLPPAPPVAQPSVKIAHAAPMLPEELMPLDNNELSESKSQQPAPAESQTAATMARAPLTLSAVLLPVWLAGVLYCVYRSAGQWQAARRLVQTSQECASDSLLRLYQAEACRIGVRRLPRLRLSSQADGPILIGVWRPAIILPADCERTFAESELRLMLAHELAHHQRKDLAWNWLPTVVTWLFYFHPLVWQMTRSWSEAQEAACDETLLQQNVAPPTEYGRLLLKLAALSPQQSPATLATAGVLGAYRNLERRILTMTRVRPFSARRIVLAAVAVLSIGVCGIVPWRLVAQAAEPTIAKDAKEQPAQPPTGTFITFSVDDSAKATADAAANDSDAQAAIKTLQGLGAEIGSKQNDGRPATLTIEITPAFYGTTAELKLLNDLPDVRALTIDLRDAKTASQELEKLVENKQADPKLLEQNLQDVDAAAIGELKLKRPLAQLAILHLTDATLTKMSALPECRQLSLSSSVLSAEGWARLAKLASGVRTLTLQTGMRDPAAGEQRAADGVNDDALRSVSEIKSIKSLNLFNVNVTDAGLAQLAALDKLELVTLGRCPKAHGLGLANWRRLKKLSIIEAPIDAAGLKAIAQLSTLEYLLMQPGDLVGADMAPLSALANLRTLNITTNLHGEEALKKTPLGDEVLRAAAALPKLEALFVTGIGVSDAGLTAFKGPQLHELWLGQLDVTDQGLATLASLKNLRHLTLSGKLLTDDSLRHLTEMSALERLRLGDCEIQGKGLAALAKLDQLKTLSIERSPLDDLGAVTLSKLTAVEHLTLAGTKITDKSLSSIATLPKLQSLSLDDNKITIAGLFELRAAKHLRKLEAPGLKAPKDEVAKLRAALPNAYIATDHPWVFSNFFVGDDEDEDTPAPEITGKVAPALTESNDKSSSNKAEAPALISFAQADPSAAGERKITITGRAADADGKPVAGATVYLAPVRFLGSADAKTFAKTTTNTAGEYEFRDFALPLHGDDHLGGYQVYGVAPGMGPAWQGTRIFHDKDRPQPGEGEPADHHPDQVFKNDKLTADLRFGPAEQLRGRLLDEQDKPIAGASVKVFQCRALASKKMALEDRYLVKLADDFIVTVDADGRFAIAGLPEKSVALLQITLPDSEKLFIHATTGAATEITHGDDDPGILVGDVNLKLQKTRIQVLYGDKENPAKGATVGAAIHEPSGFFATTKADDRGIALLSLPSGKYQLGVTPDKSTAPIEYVETRLPLVVRDTPQEQSSTVRIPAGAVLEVEVDDADSGKPISNIEIAHYDMQTNDEGISLYKLGDMARTDAEGKLRVGVLPGKKRVTPAPNPAYSVVGDEQHAVDFIAGKTVSLKFKLRKQPKADDKPEGKADKKPNETSEVKTDKNDPAATKALARLKELGAQPANARQIGVQSGWRGTDADLKLINDLPELKWLYVELERVTPAGFAEINRKTPIETLILRGLSDANLEQLPRLPACQRLMLVSYELTPAGFALLAKRAKGLEFLDLSGGPMTDEMGKPKFALADDGLAKIGQMEGLKGLYLYESTITDDGLAQLAALKSLAELTFNTCPQVHGRGYANLAAVKSLRRLTIFAQPIAGEELRGMAKVVQLEMLMLNPANLLPAKIEADDVAELAKLTNLQTLDLRAWDWNVKESFGNELLRATSRIKPLRELRLYSVSADADGIDSLATAANLRELILKIEYNERNVAALARLKNLQKVGLSGRGAVSDEVLAQLARLTPLIELSITGSEIDDRGLVQLKNLTALEKLNLPDSKITGAGLASLDKLTKLNTLTLTDSPFHDAGARHLRLLPALHYLNLGKTKITDESIGAIGALKNLQMLTIDGDTITARGLTQLKDLKRLSYISAEGLAGTQDEIAAMRAVLKEVTVTIEPRPLGMTGTAVFVRTREAD